MPSTLLTSKEALEIIIKRTGKPMSSRQFRHECQMGHIKAIKKAHRYFFEPEDLDNYQRPKRGAPFKSST